jgi:hypothetical protein
MIDVDVDVFSRTGLVFGQPADFVPLAPDTGCSFSLHPVSDSGAALGERIETCVRAWVELNGVPDQIDIEVTTTQGTQVGAFKIGGTDYSLSGLHTMTAHEPVSVGYSCELLQNFSEEILDNLQGISLSEVNFRGAGASSENVTLASFATVWNASGEVAARARMAQSIQAGELYWLVSEMKSPPDGADSYTVAGTISPIFMPALPNFQEAVLRAAGSGEGAVGCASWVVAGAFPRDGFIAWTIDGKASPAIE